MTIINMWSRLDNMFVVTPILGFTVCCVMFCGKQLVSFVGYKLRRKIFRQHERRKPDPGQPLDLSDPSSYGLQTSRHEVVQIPTAGGTLGGWFLQPEAGLAVQEVIILYNHGVSKTRGAIYRVGTYNVLLRSGFRILTYDYRGFGDSTKVDTVEESMVEDCQTALDWLRRKEGDDVAIMVWGHSMGTGVTCHAMANEFMAKENTNIVGVVLESPFNSFVGQIDWMRKGVKNAVVRGLLSLVCLEGLAKLLDVAFYSERWILKIRCPILILHAEDDYRIPFSLGKKLFEDAKAAGKEDMDFFNFDAKFGFNHKWINKSEQLPDIIDTFYEKL